MGLSIDKTFLWDSCLEAIYYKQTKKGGSSAFLSAEIEFFLCNGLDYFSSVLQIIHIMHPDRLSHQLVLESKQGTLREDEKCFPSYCNKAHEFTCNSSVRLKGHLCPCVGCGAVPQTSSPRKLKRDAELVPRHCV